LNRTSFSPSLAVNLQADNCDFGMK
jgi:hypothetical protein